jgi:hypothetical protein
MRFSAHLRTKISLAAHRDGFWHGRWKGIEFAVFLCFREINLVIRNRERWRRPVTVMTVWDALGEIERVKNREGSDDIQSADEVRLATVFCDGLRNHTGEPSLPRTATLGRER